jgi:ABC-type amino acid transport substrate-binding protein
MKKIISIFLVLMLLLGVLAVPALAEDYAIGTLSYLNMTEGEGDTLAALRETSMKILNLHGVLKSEKLFDGKPICRYFDTRSALLLALDSGNVKAISIPYYMAKYLCANNDKMAMNTEYHPENMTGASEYALARLSDGYSFMMKKGNDTLKDAFDEQIVAMKEDGTLQKLVDEHIIKVSEGGEPVAVAFEQFDGDPIKVGISGDLPPVDYVAADGSFAGFNTAVLAEIGKRLQKNIELVQVENVGRSLALSEGRVDVVFWTRAMSEKMVELIVANRRLSDEEKEAKGTERREALTAEEKAILDEGLVSDTELKEKLHTHDMPEDTIITRPYFSDFQVLVTLK